MKIQQLSEDVVCLTFISLKRYCKEIVI